MRNIMVVLLLVFMLASQVIFADKNNISKVSVDESKGRVEINVFGTQKPTFTVFKLRNPLRLIIDISNATINGIESPIDVNNEVVKQIITSQFEDDVNTTSRIMLSLKNDSKYSVNSVGNKFVLTLENEAINGNQKIVKNSSETELKTTSEDRKQIEEFQNQLKQKEEQLAKKESELTLKERELAQRKSEVLLKEKELNVLKSQISEKDKVVISLQTSLEENKKQINQNQSEMIKLKNQISKNDNNSESTTQLKTTLSKLENENTALSSKQKEFNSKLDLLKQEKEALTKEKEIASSKYDEQKKIYMQLEEKHKSLMTENKNLDIENQLLRKQLNETTAKNNELVAKNSELEAASKKEPQIQIKEVVKEVMVKEDIKQSKINDLKVLKYTDKIVVDIDIENHAGDFEILELENPKRLVVELPNTILNTSLNKKTDINQYILKSIRLGTEDSKARVVFDISEKQNLPKYFLKKDKNVLKFTMLIEQQSIAKNLIDVGFNSEKNYSNISLKFDDSVKYSVIREDNDLSVIKFYNVKTPDSLQNTIDSTNKNSKIKMISVFQSNEDTILAVKLAGKAENNINFDETTKLLTWKFKDAPTEIKNVVKRDVDEIEYASAETASYQAENDDIANKKYYGKRISIDFKNADIHDVLQLIADVSKINIITSDDVAGSVTMKLRNVQWDKALDVILKTKSLGKEVLGNIIRVAPQETLDKEYQSRIDIQLKKEDNIPLGVRLIPVNYARAEELVEQVKGLLSKRGKVTVDIRTNVLIVNDVFQKLDESELLVRNLDAQTPQVLIEGRIVEASSNFSTEQGINWGGDYTSDAAHGNQSGLTFPSSTKGEYLINLPTTSTMGSLAFNLGSINDSLNLNFKLSAAEAEGQLKIISSPRISTLDNKEATIETGSKIPILTLNEQGVPTTKLIDAQIKLIVKPHVTADGSIILKMELKKEEPDFSRRNSLGDPTIISKSATTELLIKDGQTAVIGGMYTKKISDETKSVPFFGKIPILGWFFKSTSHGDERSELLIFITPRIINKNNGLISK